MEIIERSCSLQKFEYQGTLELKHGGYPKMNVGLGIMPVAEDNHIVSTRFDYSFNNYDASLHVIVDYFTVVDFHLAKPTEEQILEEVKLMLTEFDKLLIYESHVLNKHAAPPLKWRELESTVIDLIRRTIALFG